MDVLPSSQTIRGAYVTPAFFQVAQTQPLLGRLFGPIERAEFHDRRSDTAHI